MPDRCAPSRRGCRRSDPLEVSSLKGQSLFGRAQDSFVDLGAHDVVGGDPGIGAAPCVTFNEDVLAGGTSGTDSVNSGLVQVQNESLIKAVVLVV